MKKELCKLFSVIALSLLATPTFAGIAVIVHPDNNSQIDKNDIRAIYLAKTNSFDGGAKATPVDVDNNDDMKKIFAKQVLRKSVSSLNSYWSRMIFSARGNPPKSMSMAGVKAKVANDKSAIGYIDSSMVDGSVKVVLTIN